MNFKDLGLIAPITDALTKEGYEAPTPIQRGAIPPALEGRDVLGCAQTGTGKTCAFATPILQRMARDPKKGPRLVRALVLTPTRELALQIQESFATYGKALPLRSAVIFGGVGQAPQVEKLRRGVDILVATPGRLLDLHGQKLLDLSNVEYFVLDEADRMLDMGFIHDVRRILKLLPQKKQTLFFSATMPPEVMELVDSLLHDPARVAVDPVSSPVEVIRQSLYYVDKGNKTKLLIHLLEDASIKNALVFTRTKHGANKVATDLLRAGISAAAIHGNKSQTARQNALFGFKGGEVRVLVATDIAARGLDIEELSHVFNYNLPDVPETYVHRIGRTGRAGNDGVAISFCEYGEMGDLKAVERLIGKSIQVVENHQWPMQVHVVEEKRATGRPERREKRPVAPRKSPVQPKNSVKQPVEKQAKKPPAKSPKGGQTEGQPKPVTAAPAGDVNPPVRPSALAQDKIMDATARLFASKPRTPTPKISRPTPKKAEQEPREAQAPKRERQPKSGGGAKGERQPRKARESLPPKGSQESKGPQKSGEAQKPKAPRPARQSGRGNRNQRPREPLTLTATGAQKDSTEQESLMKPYYLTRD